MPEPVSLRVYRRLLRLYPAGFRESYGDLLEREFRDELQETAGALAVAELWIRLIADLAVTLPSQLAHEVGQDARHTLRLWARRPGQTFFAILVLAIGTGANTGVFSVVNALLLRSLPFKDPGRLAYLSNFFPPHDSAAQFHDWRPQSTYLADTALFESIDVNLGGAGEWRRAHVTQTSANFFSLMGVQPVLGRGFVGGDDVNGVGWGPGGRNAVAVISYGLWQALFGGDAKALGSTVRVDGTPLTVVGIAPPAFDYPPKTALWKPAAFSPGNNGWEVIARLKPGVSWAQARQTFTVEANRLWPNRTAVQKIAFPFRMTPLRDELAGPVKDASLVLMACVVLILLIACTNVANLTLARTADRARELYIRSALGASRGRVCQQLLTECLLLSLAAATVGVMVALWTISLAAKVQPAPTASQGYSLLDARVLGFAAAVSLASGLLFGVLPSLYAVRVDRLGSGARADERGGRRLREGLVAGQVVLALILLVSSLSLDRAFQHLMRINHGFVPQGVVTVNVSLEGTTHDGDGRGLAYFQEALARIRRLPGVEAASATEFLPLYATTFVGGRFEMDGRPASESSTLIPVLSDYFRTMGGEILWGREFRDAEIGAKANVAVVNQHFAGEFGPPGSALGRTITTGGHAPWKIVGIVKGMDYPGGETRRGEDLNQIFVPSESPGGFFSTFVARVDGRAEDHLAMVRDAIHSVDPQVPVFGVETMEQRLDEALARPQFYRTAVVCFAGFALLLAVLGIYAIVSYAVAQRRHEMGVRLALGSTAIGLRTRLLRQALLTAGTGTVAGIAGALLSGRFLAMLVESAKPADAATCAAAVALLGAIAAAGAWMATRRIARLDIVEILRTE